MGVMKCDRCSHGVEARWYKDYADAVNANCLLTAREPERKLSADSQGTCALDIVAERRKIRFTLIARFRVGVRI
jgi:hypothetical protein